MSTLDWKERGAQFCVEGAAERQENIPAVVIVGNSAFAKRLRGEGGVGVWDCCDVSVLKFGCVCSQGDMH